MSDYPEAISSVKRKARKHHECCECGSSIGVNEEYQYTSGIWEGRPHSFKQCMPCNSLFIELSSEADYIDEGPAFEGIREHLFNCDYHLEPSENVAAFLERSEASKISQVSA